MNSWWFGWNKRFVIYILILYIWSNIYFIWHRFIHHIQQKIEASHFKGFWFEIDTSSFHLHTYFMYMNKKGNWHGFQMSISCLVFVTSRRIRCSYIFYYRTTRKPLEMHNNSPQLHWVLLANISICYWRCRPMLFHTKSIPSQKLNNLIKREKEIYMLWLIFDSIPQHTDIIQPIRYWTVYI